MASTIATMAMLNAKCLTTPKSFTKPTVTPAKPISLLSIQNQLITTKLPSSMAIAGAFFATLSSCDSAFAAQQIAEIAEVGGSDNRGLALLLPLIPAIAWVLYNILQPALNQINKMRNQKGVIVGLGLGGLAGAFTAPPEASASEFAMLADAGGGSDSRGQLLLIVLAPAIGWVLYNILQPALNQINKMRNR